MPASTSPQFGLTDGDLSAIYQSTDKMSGAGQKLTKRLIRLELSSLIIGAAAGVASVRVGAGRIDVLAIVSAVLFLVALGSTTFRSLSKPEDKWYTGRAGAESARTLAWRYALGGDPFPLTLTPTQASERLLSRLRRVLEELGETDLEPTPVEAHELTDAMKQLRSTDLAVRKAVYKSDRIENQMTWYTRRGAQHARAARIWLAVASLTSLLGIVAAFLKIFDAIGVDLLGVFGAASSAAIAWSQLNQFHNQSTAYRYTTQELRIIRDRIDDVEDVDWPSFVSDSEDAISREHTMWLARHGHPGLMGRTTPTR